MKRVPNPKFAEAAFELGFVDAEGRPVQLRHYPIRWKNAADANFDFARIARGERPVRAVKPLLRTKGKR